MALGASTRAVTRLVVVQSARLAAVGGTIGLVLGFSVMKFLSTVVRLDNVSVIDPGAFVVERRAHRRRGGARARTVLRAAPCASIRR